MSPSLPVSRRSRTLSTLVHFASTRLLPWSRPLHGERWELPSNLEGRVRGWVRQKGSPCPRQPICLAWTRVSTRRFIEYMADTRDDLGSGNGPTGANPSIFESPLNLALHPHLLALLTNADTMSRFAPHRSSNSNPQNTVVPKVPGSAEGLHVRLQGRGRSVQDATESDADVRKFRHAQRCTGCGRAGVPSVEVPEEVLSKCGLAT